MRTKVVCQLDECPRYRNAEKPMELMIEYETTWQFRCPTCRNVRVVGKDKVGGTIGSGVRPDGPRAIGKGF